ncbi:DNA polymerase III subunit delta' [Gracilibacillus ureilyticus]|uniref:DNA polymerase III subunit delta' n=1 Tax=Gracilibacillus ureilyticus TaxID=531814 RepID=UPI000B7DCBF0|nr:DNA polymerase III subunit delta' [Gracilibacillus ureilyticus]
MNSWEEMFQQQPIVSKMLTNSIKKKRISHAYLLYGDKGTGKYALAQLVAKSIFCKNKEGYEPCGTCLDCKRINSGNHPDLHIIHPDGASIKTDQIAHLKKEFTYTGLESNKKVYIIEHADKMTDNAANRLLKFLEEPSQETTAVLLTENSQSLLSTIRSRCQILALMPLNSKQLEQKLIETGITEGNARILTNFTRNLDEALDKSKDTWFAQARKLVVQLVEMLQNNRDEVPIFVHTQWMAHFKEKTQLQEGLDLLLVWFRDVIHYHMDDSSSIVFLHQMEKLEQASMYWSIQDITKHLQTIMEAKRKLEQNVHPQLVIEQLTLQIQR